ncbi:MAG: heme-degrading domain-containing protein [Alphaproteobacteria bacterium]|nr:heme-degrading domain-containing protein [Alphaproteobacteria bacterium]
MSLAQDIAKIEEQEQVLRFKAFDEHTAWALGSAMRAEAEKQKLPLVIDIRIGPRQMFFAALPGTAPDNSEWVRRKANSVLRFHRSSYLLNRQYEQSARSFGTAMGIDPMDHANAGGGFPLTIEGVGVIGSITVSGIPQRDDHGFVVQALCAFLGKNHAKLALEPEGK